MKILILVILSLSLNVSLALSPEKAYSSISAYANLNLNQGELPHSIGVSNDIPAYEAIIGLMNERKLAIDLKNSHFLAVVMQHYDDDPIHYFSLEVVNDEIKIVELFSFYMPDTIYDFPENLQDPLVFSLYLMDIENWHYDFFEKLAEQ